jgi:hypothetical protein
MDSTGKVNPTRSVEHLKVQNTLYDRRGNLTQGLPEVDFEAVDVAAFILKSLAGAFGRELDIDTRSGGVAFLEEDAEVARLSGKDALELVERVHQTLAPLLERRV